MFGENVGGGGVGIVQQAEEGGAGHVGWRDADGFGLAVGGAGFLRFQLIEIGAAEEGEERGAERVGVAGWGCVGGGFGEEASGGFDVVCEGEGALPELDGFGNLAGFEAEEAE